MVVQIVLGVILLVGLILPWIKNKTWHWSQNLLVNCILLAAAGCFVLGAETVRTHHALRSKIPKLEKDVEAAELRTVQLVHGFGDTLGVLELEHRLQMVSRDRGRVWRQVKKVGEVSQEGQVEVEIPLPKPHGLENGSIVFAFESDAAQTVAAETEEQPAPVAEEQPAAEGEAAAPADPTSRKQYLGEFRVIETKETGVVLEPVQLINNVTGQRLVDSQGAWSLYESMPSDRHSLFADMSEEELQQLLPAESVEEYLRHGKPAQPADNEFDRVGLDENDEPVNIENLDKAVKFIFDRPLRDYANLFAQLAQDRVLLMASKQAVQEDNAKLVASIESGKRLGEFRQQQIQSLSADLEGMKQDRAAIEAHRDQVLNMLANAKQLITASLEENSQMARQLKSTQLQQLQLINSTAPAPSGVETATP